MSEAVVTFGFELLSEELEEHIAQLLARQLYRDTCLYDVEFRHTVYKARTLNWTFWRAVGRLWQLFGPKQKIPSETHEYALRPDAAESFVEGVMRFHCRRLLEGIPLGSMAFQSIYNIVYDACSVRHPYSLSEAFHSAIPVVGRRLFADGPLRQLPVEQRDKFQNLVYHMFRFLDCYYVPRGPPWLTSTEQSLKDIFIES